MNFPDNGRPYNRATISRKVSRRPLGGQSRRRIEKHLSVGAITFCDGPALDGRLHFVGSSAGSNGGPFCASLMKTLRGPVGSEIGQIAHLESGVRRRRDVVEEKQ